MRSGAMIVSALVTKASAFSNPGSFNSHLTAMLASTTIVTR
jgi:hypothetical protein